MMYPPCRPGPCTGNRCAPLFPRGVKLEWPELVGANEQVAKTTIEKENPSVTVISLYPGHGHQDNVCLNRVWLYVDGPNGKVTRVPIVG
ncbi:hypothetical protein Leryth_026811 [Lithospermum erythrorhizon]|nr:hypothetical protein Leryth_026811 [Lithospermum erythrorhizon]